VDVWLAIGTLSRGHVVGCSAGAREGTQGLGPWGIRSQCGAAAVSGLGGLDVPRR